MGPTQNSVDTSYAKMTPDADHAKTSPDAEQRWGHTAGAEQCRHILR